MATEWSKLRVADLRAELKRRGLPQTGLKHDLVTRLYEADIATVEPPQADEVGETHADLPTEHPDQSAVPPGQDHPETSQLPSSVPPPPDAGNVDVDKGLPLPPTPPPQSSGNPHVPQEPSAEKGQLEVATAKAHDTAPATASKDVANDSQKRKRRSTTPTPSAKRARQDEDREDAVDFSNTEIVGAKQDLSQSASPRDDGLDGCEQLPTQHDEGKDATVAQHNLGSSSLRGQRLQITGEEAYLERVAIGQSSKSEPRPPSRALPGTESQQIKPKQHEEGVAGDDATSIHPPTAALYIKDLMRPMKPEMLRTYIMEIATPAESVPDPDLIEECYLDQIRTHAFVHLSSVSAAVRVRSALHERVWPDESNRKPLWVDFIPPEKVQDWIYEEQSPQSRSSRWTVVYIHDEEGVTARLTDVAQDSKSVRNLPTGPGARSAAPTVYPGIEAAPKGPRGMGSYAKRPAILNALRTRSIPSLSYQPVSEELAQRRLSNLHSFVSKDRKRDLGHEINRYTFEDHELFVDRGKEVFIGIRPPRREKARQDQLRRDRLGAAGIERPPRPAVTDEDRYSRKEDDRRPRFGHERPPVYRDFRDGQESRSNRDYNRDRDRYRGDRRRRG